MTQIKNTIKAMAALLVIAATVFLTSCSNSQNGTVGKSEIDSLRSQIAQLTSGNEAIANHLVKFDTLDFTIFSNQEWVRFHESHSKDIIVHWPDGHFTTGLEKHIEDLKAMFVYAPNTQIKEHPIRFGSGNYTAVTGIMTGTFSKPMPIGNGKFIQPTGKSFKLPMATIGIWKDGSMAEEYLYWDNQTYMNQLGLGK
jgi:SnoaL-like polyketide cyclase